MKILFVTNYYPPHYVGGYELHCARVAEWLARNGCMVRVLTSDWRREDAPLETAVPGLEVLRTLELRYWTDVADPGFWRRERRDVRRFRRVHDAFGPDLVVLWNMRKLAAGIVLEAQRRARVLIYHLMDEWAAEFRDANGLPQFWARPARSPWGRALKPSLRRLYNAVMGPDVSRWAPRRAVLVSRALGDLLESRGLHIPTRRVSYITYDPDLFEDAAERSPRAPGEPVRFLWAGRMCEGKGLLTAFDALDRLFASRPGGWRVDFCGPAETDFLERVVRPRLAGAPWKELARHLGSLPHAEMPRQYREHDAFLFTSEVHEGLPGTIIEAFAAGLPVIGTLTGGTKDVLRPEANCLVYPMGDAEALAGAMERLIADPALRERLSAGVAHFAREECSSDAVFPRLLAFYRESLVEEAS